MPQSFSRALSRGVALLSVIALLLSSCALPRSCRAAPPPQLLPSELGAQEGDKETLTAPLSGLLLIPRGAQADSDAKYHARYHAVCYVYAGEAAEAGASAPPARYLRRFAVHAPELDALPLARRVARMCLLLYGLNRERLHYDHAYRQTVDVWLSGQAASNSSPDVGGEQFQNQIYIYNIFAERKPIEWAREIAHEYGHYALPGISGYKSPEEWANGVLGERLFLKWLAEGFKAGTLKADDVPFVRPDDIGEYVARQVTPLIRRIARDGVTDTQLARQDAGGMDAYTALALYLDTVNGTGALLNAMSYTQPKTAAAFARGDDFLRGAQASLQGATDIHYTAPLAAHDGRADFWMYLPRGEYSVDLEGSARSWVFASESRGIHLIGKNGVIVNQNAWRKLTLRFPDNADNPASLVLHRKGAEVQ